MTGTVISVRIDVPSHDNLITALETSTPDEWVRVITGHTADLVYTHDVRLRIRQAPGDREWPHRGRIDGLPPRLVKALLVWNGEVVLDVHGLVIHDTHARIPVPWFGDNLVSRFDDRFLRAWAAAHGATAAHNEAMQRLGLSLEPA